MSIVLVIRTVAPQITCPPASAKLYAPDVQLECRVRSRPGPTSLYWIVDSNGTTVSSGESMSEHTTLVRVGTLYACT